MTTLVGLVNSGQKVMFPFVSLKQVVDCRLPERASYQAIVLRCFRLSYAKAGTQSTFTPMVKFQRYSSLPMVDTMALQISRSEPGYDTTVDVVNASFAYHFDGILRAETVFNMTWRAGESGWDGTSWEEINKKTGNAWMSPIRDLT
jgi:hypothetical protein